LSYNFSEKQFLGGEEVFRDETNLSERRKGPIKYTKLQLTPEDNKVER
jgi:hypothetical protein